MNKNVFTSMLWVGLLFGGILAVLAWQDSKIASRGTPEPEDITLDAPAKRGLSGNVHLRVSQFRVGDNFVFETKNNAWQRVWGPLYGSDKQIRLIVKSGKMKSAPEVAALQQIGKVTGIITNDIHSLGSAERKKLEESYPGVNFDSLPILEQEKSFPGPTRRLLMVGGA